MNEKIEILFVKDYNCIKSYKTIILKYVIVEKFLKDQKIIE